MLIRCYILRLLAKNLKQLFCWLFLKSSTVQIPWPVHTRRFWISNCTTFIFPPIKLFFQNPFILFCAGFLFFNFKMRSYFLQQLHNLWSNGVYTTPYNLIKSIAKRCYNLHYTLAGRYEKYHCSRLGYDRKKVSGLRPSNFSNFTQLSGVFCQIVCSLILRRGLT